MWPFNKSLDSVLNKTKTIRIHGVKFVLKKLDIEVFLDGSKVMLQAYDTYKVGKEAPKLEPNMDKIKGHFRDVFMGSVIEPKLSRKKGEADHIYVDNLFTEWDLANKLYEEIIEHTYGKKNFKLSI